LDLTLIEIINIPQQSLEASYTSLQLQIAKITPKEIRPSNSTSQVHHLHKLLSPPPHHRHGHPKHVISTTACCFFSSSHRMPYTGTSSITSLTIATPKEYLKERRCGLFESFMRGKGDENAPSDVLECNSRVPNPTVGIAFRIELDMMQQWAKDIAKTPEWNSEDPKDSLNKVCSLFFWRFLLMVVWIKEDRFDGPVFVDNDGWNHRFSMFPESINALSILLTLAARQLFRAAWLGFPDEKKTESVTATSSVHGVQRRS
jgi:hypothetical protein